MGDGVTAAHGALDAESSGSNPDPPVTKFCKRCATHKAIADFNKRYDRPGQYQHLCRACNSDYGKEWHRKNKDRRVVAAVKRRKELREWVADQKRGKPCTRCGYLGIPAALHWHHKDPSEKSFTISTGIDRHGKETIRAELQKCELLCANCHAEVTWGDQES